MHAVSDSGFFEEKTSYLQSTGINDANLKELLVLPKPGHNIANRLLPRTHLYAVSRTFAPFKKLIKYTYRYLNKKCHERLKYEKLWLEKLLQGRNASSKIDNKVSPYQ